MTTGVRAPKAAARLMALLNGTSAKERTALVARAQSEGGMSNVVKAAVVAAMVLAGLFAPRPAAAYSVLAHEANIDALWDSTIAPMLRARFPDASRLSKCSGGSPPESASAASARWYYATAHQCSLRAPGQNTQPLALAQTVQPRPSPPRRRP